MSLTYRTKRRLQRAGLIAAIVLLAALLAVGIAFQVMVKDRIM